VRAALLKSCLLYSVLQCKADVAGSGHDLLQVRNPWGSGEFESGEWDDDGPGWEKFPEVAEALGFVAADDGVFWVSKEEFFRFFPTLYLSASDMTHFKED